MLHPSRLFAVLLMYVPLALALLAQETLNRPQSTGHGRFFDIQVRRQDIMQPVKKLIQFLLAILRPIVEVEGTRSRARFLASRGTYIRVGPVLSTGLRVARVQGLD